MKILLSIKPDFAFSILDGSKRFEFRRRIHRDDRVHTVVIYATMPVGRVIGEFTIRDIHTESPDRLWRKTSRFSGISKEFFDSYFEGRDIGHAIEVKKVKRYRTPRPIHEFLAHGIAPQSYAYLPS
ncbi:MAG: ASCH domain-containing protein [Gemmatimonadaceae bacterium]|nr:ASCH domain-containing protein [Gemmatimonadaceae bacterium]